MSPLRKVDRVVVTKRRYRTKIIEMPWIQDITKEPKQNYARFVSLMSWYMCERPSQIGNKLRVVRTVG